MKMFTHYLALSPTQSHISSSVLDSHLGHTSNILVIGALAGRHNVVCTATNCMPRNVAFEIGVVFESGVVGRQHDAGCWWAESARGGQLLGFGPVDCQVQNSLCGAPAGRYVFCTTNQCAPRNVTFEIGVVGRQHDARG